jgi:flagellar hook protein FlgE
MVRSLYSGVSGLTAHQTKMDVIGNNIANVNTFGFKASSASFADVYYQTANSATAGTDSFAGNNPSTIGYGTQICDITKNMSMSSFQTTNRTLDLAISGDGFFSTATFKADASGAVAADAKPASVKYTRGGKLGIDSNGNLVSSNNTFVLGTKNTDLTSVGDASAAALAAIAPPATSAALTYANTININDLINAAWTGHTPPLTYADLSAFSIGTDGVITATYNGEMKALARINVAVFDNQEGLQECGDTSYIETSASGVAKFKKPGDSGAGTVESGKLEMSNVNLAQEFSDMIVTQRGFQANARIITTSDSMLEELVNLKR